MRMLMYVEMAVEPFNAAVRDGSVGKKVKKILDAIKPESVYFTEQTGVRGAIMVVNVDDPSDIPGLAEPWFLTFDATVKLRIAMTPEDLGKGNLEELGKKWA